MSKDIKQFSCSGKSRQHRICEIVVGLQDADFPEVVAALYPYLGLDNFEG